MRKCCGEPGTDSEPRRGGGIGGDEVIKRRDNNGESGGTLPYSMRFRRINNGDWPRLYLYYNMRYKL